MLVSARLFYDNAREGFSKIYIFLLECLQHKFIRYSTIAFILTETESSTNGCHGVND